MKRLQTRILAAGIVVAAGMLLYPPFHIRVTDTVSRKMGYGFVWNPPKFGFLEATVNLELLALQWLAVAVATGVLVWLAGRR